VCWQTPHSVCGSVVFKQGLLVGMHEETMITQEAQDHAMVCLSSAKNIMLFSNIYQMNS